MRMRLLPGVVVATLLVIFFECTEPPAETPAHSVSASSAARPGFVPDFSREFFTAFAKSNPKPEAKEKHRPARNSAARGTVSEPARGTPSPAEFTDSAAPYGSAYASLTLPDEQQYSADSADNIPSGAPPPLDMLFDPAHSLPPAPPARGLRAWTSAETSRAAQEPSLYDTTAYSLKETKYSAGLDLDWSADTVLGVSVDKLDARVSGGHAHDFRSTDIDGIVANARVDTLLFDKYLLGLKGSYGRLDNSGAGGLGDLLDPDAAPSPFTETEHRSDMYGLSGVFGVPMLAGGFRMLVKGGAEYTRIDAAPFEYVLDAAGPMVMKEETDSHSSLRFPVDFSVERDFVKHWGVITPRVTGGYVYESSGNANGVRALGAFSASRIENAGGFVTSPAPFFSLEKSMYHIGAGLDLRTAGGWNLTAHYRRDIADAYNRDTFRLELGRSF